MIQIHLQKLIILQEHHKVTFITIVIVNCYWMTHFSEVNTSANMETTPVHEDTVTKHSHPPTNEDIIHVTKDEQQITWSGWFKREFIVIQKSM